MLNSNLNLPYINGYLHKAMILTSVAFSSLNFFVEENEEFILQS